MDRTERFYKIQRMLTTKASVTMREMLNALEVSRATLNRDLAYLKDRMGVPIEWDPGVRGYVLAGKQTDTRSFELPGVWFNQQEIHSLLTMIGLISTLEPGGLLQLQLAPFKARLERLLDDGAGDSKEVMNRIRIVPMAQRQVSGSYFQIITFALVHRKQLHLNHFSRQTGQTTERVVSPQRIVYYRDNWYLDAYCHLRDGLRSFALDALRDVQLREVKAKVVSDAELRDTFEASYGIFTGKQRQVAQLKFTAFRAQWVAREVWHPEQKGQLHPDGSYTLEVPYGEDWELIQDILRQGAEVEVLGPTTLKQRVRETIDKMSAIYKAG